MEKQLLDIVEQFQSEAFWLLLKLIGVGIILLVIKGYIESIAAYIQFRLDKRLGQGVRVRLRGAHGKIIDYNFSWIFVQSGDVIEIIAMKRWRFEKWAIVNGNGE